MSIIEFQSPSQNAEPNPMAEALNLAKRRQLFGMTHGQRIIALVQSGNLEAYKKIPSEYGMPDDSHRSDPRTRIDRTAEALGSRAIAPADSPIDDIGAGKSARRSLTH